MGAAPDLRPSTIRCDYRRWMYPIACGERAKEGRHEVANHRARGLAWLYLALRGRQCPVPIWAGPPRNSILRLLAKVGRLLSPATG